MSFRSRRPGYVRLTLELPVVQHARFKALCAARRTTMHDQLAGFVRAQLEQPDALLVEALYIQVSPEWKRGVEEYAAEKQRSLSEIFVEAFALFERSEEPVEMVVKGDYGRGWKKGATAPREPVAVSVAKRSG